MTAATPRQQHGTFAAPNHSAGGGARGGEDEVEPGLFLDVFVSQRTILYMISSSSGRISFTWIFAFMDSLLSEASTSTVMRSPARVFTNK
jgi:hypothetical protein